MTKVVPKRVTAQIEGDFVVFLMPPFGLAKASSTTEALGHLESARGRMEDG